MDKWKDTELSKMKNGGNKQAKDFLEKHSDWQVRSFFQQQIIFVYKDCTSRTIFASSLPRLVTNYIYTCQLGLQKTQNAGIQKFRKIQYLQTISVIFAEYLHNNIIQPRLFANIQFSWYFIFQSFGDSASLMLTMTSGRSVVDLIFINDI